MNKITYSILNDAPHQVFSPSDYTLEERQESYPDQVSNRLQFHVVTETEERMEFDLVGADVSLANALRRIMLAEVPTMAVEHVYMYMNTSVIFDEVLAHRIGLIPIAADPRKFVEITPEAPDSTEENTIVFNMEVKCGPPPKNYQPDETGRPYTLHVYSSSFQWVPQGSQADLYPEGLKPVHDDILIAKLRPGQEITMEMHCRKGTGKDHAKYSPVSTASYRLLPRVTIKEDVFNEQADELVEKCPMNVFDIEDLGHSRRAVVKRPRECTMCRECIREGDWDKIVSLQRVNDHFIFSIEPVGMLSARDILKEAVGVLREKCRTLISEIDKHTASSTMDTDLF